MIDAEKRETNPKKDHGPMPTILFVRGWRFFFYANERTEPMHVHARKAGMECKYWLNDATFDAIEAFAHGMRPRDRREVRQIIFEHFDQLRAEWKVFEKRKLS
jgi:hypothetical protein